MNPALEQATVDPGRLAPAALAALALAVDPVGLGGVVLRGRPGPARDRWKQLFADLLPDDTPWRKVPCGVSADRLLGGLDYAATLASGTPVMATGILAAADGGIVEVAMAERLEAAPAAIIAAALDAAEVVVERDGFARRSATRIAVLALDEGLDAEEAVDPALAERLAFYVRTDELSADDLRCEGIDDAVVDAARTRLPAVRMPSAKSELLARTAMAFGIPSLRADLLSQRAARILAALAGRSVPDDDDVTLAAGLVLPQRARCMPVEAPEEEAAPEERRAEEKPPEEPPAGEDGSGMPDDVVLDAVRAAIPAGLLDAARDLKRSRSRAAGRGRIGPDVRRRRRGRPIGSMPADRSRGGRINLLETLKAAVPWQTIRRRQRDSARRVLIGKDDLRVTRFKDKNESTTVFVVDASGSQAAQRLGEVKGAIELLLAECYVRRDEVAMIAFRGSEAETVLQPTRALARAKRLLAAIPAGGATPLSAGIDQAHAVVDSIRREGRTPVVVFLTDGRGNVTRDGSKGHADATDEALKAAKSFRMTGARPIVVDTSRRPRPQARELAEAMDASYVPMPYPSAEAINAAVSAETSR